VGERDKLVLVGNMRNVDITLSPNDVNALPAPVVVEIVCVSDGRRPRDDDAGIRVDNEQPRRQTTGQKDPMMLFIEGHGGIRECAEMGPFGGYCACIAIDNRDAQVPREIDEEPMPIRGKLERFRVRWEFCLALDGEVEP